MTDLISPGSADALEETLGRLSKKAGVKATLVLDRTTGAILKTTGQASTIRPASLSNGAASSNQPGGPFASDANGGPSDETRGAEELAALVWSFVRTAGELVQEIDTEDELKFLRLRSKKQEFVIVPDAKYILILVHDTPPA